jgi:hypothetical protein
LHTKLYNSQSVLVVPVSVLLTVARVPVSVR